MVVLVSHITSEYVTELVPQDTLDAKIADFHLGTIKYPEALMILWNLALPQLTGASSNLDEYDSPHYALFKPFETPKSRYSMQSWSHKVGFYTFLGNKIRCWCIGEEKTGPVEMAFGDGSDQNRRLLF
jgi:hypothetical protein